MLVQSPTVITVAGTAGANPAKGMDVLLLRLLHILTVRVRARVCVSNSA